MFPVQLFGYLNQMKENGVFKETSGIKDTKNNGEFVIHNFIRNAFVSLNI